MSKLREGAEGLAKADIAIGLIEYTEEQDLVRNIIQKLPKEVTVYEE